MSEGDPANRIHPDGVPGTEVMRLRELWGDAYYEQWRDRGDRLNDIEEHRQAGVLRQVVERGRREKAIADVWAAVALILYVAFVLGCVVAVIAMWRAR